jgi:zinc protease
VEKSPDFVVRAELFTAPGRHGPFVRLRGTPTGVVLAALPFPIMKRLLPLLGLAAGALALHAAPPAPEGFTHVKTVGGIDEYRYDANGLQVLLMPERSAPVVTFMVTYRVGSRNEVTGTTGATHLLEHLMFKGSPRFNRGLGTGYDQVLDPIGAINNATTWFDRTNYYVNSPSEHLPLIVDLLADCMRNLWLREDDRRPEMTVVRNEFERGENNPFQLLIKELFHAAYVAHPYHHSTIGWRSDIEKVSIEKLREFYDTFYWPNNATVSVIGDFEPAAALDLIKKHFGPIPSSPRPILEVYTEEPEQTGPRRLVVKKAGQLGVVALGHKIPGALHPDFAPLAILSAILTDGNNSRLYKKLTDQGLTNSVQAFTGFFRDPALHITFAAMAPGAKHDDVEKAALAGIEELKAGGVTDAEVTTAISKFLAQTAYDRDGSFAIASGLNEAIAAGDWSAYYTFEDRIKEVTAADVQRVARKYFVEDQSSTGWFVPLAK